MYQSAATTARLSNFMAKHEIKLVAGNKAREEMLMSVSFQKSVVKNHASRELDES
jgi:hypothetical protein